MSYTPRPGRLPDKVLAFFIDNPDEELTSTDVAEKFNATPASMVSTSLAPLVRMGLLKPGKLLHYSAGPNLRNWQGGAAPEPEPEPPAPVVKKAKAEKPVKPARPAQVVKKTKANKLEIRVTLFVHHAGTPKQWVELAGVEP